MDMETESEEEEDGQISKFEEQEERERQLYGQPTAADETVTCEDLSSAKSPAQPWSSTMLRLGLPISAKVRIPSSHFCGLLTDANVNRGLGEILYRNQQRSIDLPHLRDR
jgi:hypothetical protein